MDRKRVPRPSLYCWRFFAKKINNRDSKNTKKRRKNQMQKIFEQIDSLPDSTFFYGAAIILFLVFTIDWFYRWRTWLFLKRGSRQRKK